MMDEQQQQQQQQQQQRSTNNQEESYYYATSSSQQQQQHHYDTMNDWKRMASFVWGTVSIPLLVGWIAYGTESISHEIWIPLPAVGYLRYDVALLAFFCLQLPVVWLLSYLCGGSDNNNTSSDRYAQHRTAWLLWFLLCTTVPFLPDAIRPLFYTRPPQFVLRVAAEFNMNHHIPSAGIQAHDTGLTLVESQRLAQLAWDQRADWTHITTSQSLGYFQWGSSINFDRQVSRTPGLYSFALGFVTSSIDRVARESDYRLHFPKPVAHVQRVLQHELLPRLRPLYARTLNVSSTDQIVYGDEILKGLGAPAITVVLPNVLWHWIANPHTDQLYADAFERKTIHQNLDCQRTANAGFKSFLLPLTLPEGTGLLYWEPNGTRREVLYEMGKVYTFDASCVHAIRPLPYHEWNRKNVRITVQAFGVECQGNAQNNYQSKWIIFH